MGQICRAEYAGGESYESGQSDQKYIEVVDDDEIAAWVLGKKQRTRGAKRQGTGKDVQRSAEPIAGDQRKDRDRHCRDDEGCLHRLNHGASLRSPRNRSSALTSTVSKRSRMRNTKMPNTINAIKMEKATDISTTSGMPLAPVAANTRPFSRDMKPTTWVMALRRVIIISKPSRITASAKARSSRT